MNENRITSSISDFFTIYLVNERGLSINTIKSYRDTFIIFFRFLENEKNIKFNKIDISIFSYQNIMDFLDYLENKAHCSVNTRNQRLAALKSFSSYVIRTNPEYIDNFNQILNIKVKRTETKIVPYLTTEGIKLLLSAPNIHSHNGLRDTAILSLMYESGCRVQELIDLKVEDLFFQNTDVVRLHGKGNKIRLVPISRNCSNIIKKYINISSKNLESNNFLFTNHSKKQFTRAGIAYLLNKYEKIARKQDPTLFTVKVHPHVLRHSKAMHLLENGVNLIYIRDFLGHESVTTTEIYAKCNPELKRKYLSQNSKLIEEDLVEYNRNEKDELLKWLKHNIL